MPTCFGFNCRTDRETWRGGGIEVPETNSAVGPGSYDVSQSLIKQPAGTVSNNVPFLSSAPRKFISSEENGDVPGPGAYQSDTSSARTRAMDRKRQIAKLLESSIAARLKHNSSIVRRTHEQRTPGPGSYIGHEQFGKSGTGAVPWGKPNKENEGGSGLKWMRVPTAPSIPARDQSHGYEEGDNGQLIMQTAADLYGVENGGGGPMAYKPKHSAVMRSAPAFDFSKAPDRMVLLEKTIQKSALTTPGPGYYNYYSGLSDELITVDVGHAVYHKKTAPSPSFRSTVRRSMDQDDPPAVSAGLRQADPPPPGPGSYMIPSAMDVKKTTTTKDQSFLTTSERFCTNSQKDGGRNRHKGPGPGSYYSERYDAIGSNTNSHSTWARARRARRKRAGVDPIGAGGGYLKGPPARGGGSAASPSTSAPAGFGGGFRSDVGFASSSSRFQDVLKMKEGTGPGGFLPEGMADRVEKKVGRTTSSSGPFGSSAKRFLRESPTVGTSVGPGTYDVTNTPTGKPAQLLSASASLLVGSNGGGGGGGGGEEGGSPLQYVPSMMTYRKDAAKVLKGSTSSFASASKRFSPKDPTAMVPPPGHYETAVPKSKSKGVLPLGKGPTDRFHHGSMTSPSGLSPGLGPGTYDVNVPAIQVPRRVAWKKQPGMGGSAERFSQAGGPLKEQTPGPGYYNSDLLYGNLLRQTFNIAVAEASADIF